MYISFNLTYNSKLKKHLKKRKRPTAGSESGLQLKKVIIMIILFKLSHLSRFWKVKLLMKLNINCPAYF